MPTPVTTNRSYQLPHQDNPLNTDVYRLISAINSIDSDVAMLISSGGGSTGAEKLLTEFGAIGDGNSANAATNTTAITSAIAYIASTGKNVVIPYGTFVCDPFSINMTAYLSQGTFIGLDRERSILKRNATGAGAFVTIGSSSGTIFQSGVGMKNLKLDGGAQSNGPTLLCYDVARSAFENCHFSGGSDALSMLGGISVAFNTCLFDAASIGVKIDKFTSSAGGGWPNLIRFNGGEIVDNSTYGLWFDAGRSVVLNGIDVEGNGTTAGLAGNGGVYVGPNVGQEVSVNDVHSIGLVVNECWFEANRGASDLLINSGNSLIVGTTFFSTSAQVTNDIAINGGQYSIRDVNCSFSKSYNLLEGGSVLPGVIVSSQIPSISRVNSDSMIVGGGGIDVRNGLMPVVKGITSPTIQAGSGVSNGSGILTVNFPASFSSVISIVCTAIDGSAGGDTVGVRITSFSASSFSVLTTRISGGGSAAAGSIAFAWQAIGIA